MLFIIACIVSFIPYTALFFWLRKLRGDDPAYKSLCGKALKSGVLCIFPVTLFSGVSSILLRITGLGSSSPLLYQALYNFIVLALMEELVKYMQFRRVLKKTPYRYSWLDMAVLMTIVGVGFGFIEAIVYAIGASVPVVLVRGICLPHAGYGFIVGYFYGKGEKYGKPIYKWIGVLISWLLHGLYDFSLSDEFIALNDNLAIVALLLALFDIILVIKLISFAKKARKSEVYTEALYEAPDLWGKLIASEEKAPFQALAQGRDHSGDEQKQTDGSETRQRIKAPAEHFKTEAEMLEKFDKDREQT